MSSRILDELNWVAELEDIDHEICDIARDAANEIQALRAKIEQMENDNNSMENKLN